MKTYFWRPVMLFCMLVFASACFAGIRFVEESINGTQALVLELDGKLLTVTSNGQNFTEVNLRNGAARGPVVLTWTESSDLGKSVPMYALFLMRCVTSAPQFLAFDCRTV